MKQPPPWRGYVKAIVAEYPRLEGVEAPSARRKQEAVARAIETTRARHLNANLRLKLIGLVFWRKSHTIGGAALSIPCHVNTARLWQNEFLALVAEYLDLP